MEHRSHELKPSPQTCSHEEAGPSPGAVPSPQAGPPPQEGPSGQATSSPRAPASRNCLVVCGPTASGKTALGVRLALEIGAPKSGAREVRPAGPGASQIGAEILSADSRQVYRGMDIGTGKDLDEYATPRGTVPCHLIDIADPSETYSLFQYQRDFYRTFAEIAGRGRIPIVVGGTGLYIEAVLKKFEVPDVPADEAFRDAMMRRDLADLAAELKARSPALAAKAVLDCKRRVVRALEIARHTEAHGAPPVNQTAIEIRPLILLVTWPRDELHRRIRRRLEARLEKGMVDEVRRILGAGLPEKRYELFGMEYRHAARYLRGEISRDRMVRELLANIGYLARRQETYFRGMRKRGLELHEVPRADPDRALEIVRRCRLEPGA